MNIIQWAIKYSGGLIKNERQASYVILGFIILVIIISLCLIFTERETASFQGTEYNPSSGYGGRELPDYFR